MQPLILPEQLPLAILDLPSSSVQQSICRLKSINQSTVSIDYHTHLECNRVREIIIVETNETSLREELSIDREYRLIPGEIDEGTYASELSPIRYTRYTIESDRSTVG